MKTNPSPLRNDPIQTFADENFALILTYCNTFAMYMWGANYFIWIMCGFSLSVRKKIFTTNENENKVKLNGLEGHTAWFALSVLFR